MAIFELYSKRQKKVREDTSDIYIYDEIQKILKIQIIHIWRDIIGKLEYIKDSPYPNMTNKNYYKVEENYQFIINAFCREYGLFKLPIYTVNKNNQKILSDYFLEEKNFEKVIDMIELSFKVINVLREEKYYLDRPNHSKIVDKGINELNTRFKEHSIGYQFIENEIMRIDSEFLHLEAVKPALKLLNEENYQGSQEEFLSAYQHYKYGNHKEALNECLKSFESLMKSIIEKHNWEIDKNSTSRKLIESCLRNNLIPPFWETHINSLRTMLESSIPTGRNKLAGHGQGSTPTEVPDYLVAYMLHMTASTLVFLTKAEKTL